jgi:hypothetical protein
VKTQRLHEGKAKKSEKGIKLAKLFRRERV